jgi:hypothetical protein
VIDEVVTLASLVVAWFLHAHFIAYRTLLWFEGIIL